jgi:hypothetical protein
MRCAIVSLALGPRYVRLLERQRASVQEHAPQAAYRPWIDELPPRSPQGVELPWRAYCAKPYALLAAWLAGADLVVWLDAACRLVRPLDPLWAHLEAQGHYVQANGWNVGQWCSDAALKTLKLEREEAFLLPEISTMALGLNLRLPRCREFLFSWLALAADGVTFHGAHTNDIGPAAGQGVAYRNVGHVSDDARVLGHRHDQTAAAVLARGWQQTPRPVFAGYHDVPYGGVARDVTLIVNDGSNP